MTKWYHGSDNGDIKKLLPSEDLKLDYETETGLWLTSSFIQAKNYGKFVYVVDDSPLKVLDRTDVTKSGLVIEYWTSKGHDQKDVINALRSESDFKDLYDGAFLDLVHEQGYDAVKLKGEFGDGFDLWVSRKGSDKIEIESVSTKPVNEFKHFCAGL